MATLRDLIGRVEAMAGHALAGDEGVRFGPEDRPVKGVTVSWMDSPGAIRAAGENGHEVLLVHESVYFPYDAMPGKTLPADWEAWPVNRQRCQLMGERKLSCLRVHGTADQICIFDMFAEMLGLGAPVDGGGFLKVYEVPPCSLAELVQRVKTRMGMPHVRVAGERPADRPIRRVGLPWGGLGLFVNVSFQQDLVARNCDVFIAGESDSYGFRFAVESGIPMIETSHEHSENPGLRRFTEMLAAALPEVAFRFYEDRCIWRVE